MFNWIVIRFEVLISSRTFLCASIRFVFCISSILVDANEIDTDQANEESARIRVVRENLDFGSLPWLASIGRKVFTDKGSEFKHLCSAAVISLGPDSSRSKFLITTGGCANVAKYEMRQVLFFNNELIHIEKMIPHEEFQLSGPEQYNVGLVELKKFVYFDDKGIKPIHLPQLEILLNKDYQLFVAIWDFVRAWEARPPYTVRRFLVEIVNFNECVPEKIPSDISESEEDEPEESKSDAGPPKRFSFRASMKKFCNKIGKKIGKCFPSSFEAKMKDWKDSTSEASEKMKSSLKNMKFLKRLGKGEVRKLGIISGKKEFIPEATICGKINDHKRKGVGMGALLYHQEKDGEYTLVGLYNRFLGEKMPDTYTRVDYYMKWINDTATGEFKTIQLSKLK